MRSFTGRLKEEVGEAVAAIGSNAIGHSGGLVSRVNQKGNKYGNETNEKREQRTPSD